jgi:hypothetical protein
MKEGKNSAKPDNQKQQHCPVGLVVLKLKHKIICIHIVYHKKHSSNIHVKEKGKLSSTCYIVVVVVVVVVDFI